MSALVESRLPNEPLKSYSVFEASDIAPVWEATSGIVTPHHIDVGEVRDSKLRAKLSHVPLPRGEILFIDYGAEIRVEIDATQVKHYMIEIPLSGTSITYQGSRRIVSKPGQAVIVQPYEQFATEWSSDCSKLLVKLEIDVLDHYLRSILGKQTEQILQFDQSSSQDGAMMGALLRTVLWIVEEIDQPDSLMRTTQLAGSEYQRMLVSTLLHCLPNNFSSSLASPKTPKVPHYILKAEQYIRQNCHESIDLGLLASEARVSVRTLREGFKRHRAISPLRFLKNTRLDKVHLCLKEADPKTNSVTKIANFHGFTELGKFSSEYKTRFGALPSETLKSS